MNESLIRFACPVHKLELGDDLYCTRCARHFPSVDGIPVLINDANSVFSAADYTGGEAYGGASSYAGHLDDRTGIRHWYRRFIYKLSESAPPKRDYDVDQAIDHILDAQPAAKILIIGSGDTTVDARGQVVYTDVAFGKNVNCIADAHDLPFVDGAFDAIIAVAVLEHVANPYACVDEIMRVLRSGGFVFAETPFMQPVHMRAYDFTRFTHLGHRRLFRYFEEVRSGIAGGPGISAGQLLRYAFAALSDKAGVKRWLNLMGLLATYPFRWLDYLTYGNASAYDCASGFYFFGKLQDEPITDRDLIGLYRGA